MVAERAVLVDGRHGRRIERTVERTHRKDMVMHAWGGESNSYRAVQDHGQGGQGQDHDQSGVFQMSPGTAMIPAMRTSSTLPNFWNTSSRSFFEVYKRGGRMGQGWCDDKRATDMGKDMIIVESRPRAEVSYDINEWICGDSLPWTTGRRALSKE